MTVRRLLARAGVGVLALGALGGAVLGAEAFAAAHRSYASSDDAPPLEGTFGRPGDPPLRLAVLGDSTAAGLGVDRTDETVGGRLATMLAATGRRVVLDGVGVSGSRAADLGTQVSRALLHGRPDVAVVLVGANDAVHAGRLGRMRRDLAAAVRRLRVADVAVVVGTCPDMGAVRAFAHPLREIVAWSGRRVADSQVRAIRAAGGVPVDLAVRTGPVFRADPGTLAEDAFHPSADGYDLWALALYPAVYDAASRVPV
ncbi:MAG TPA: SGNH/GDSL hydrolase family protein [Mycobacteriales bacterium]|jgi:lysophospholipase L1-like esterase